MSVSSRSHFSFQSSYIISFSFFYKFNSFYLLQSLGLIRISFTSFTNSIAFLSLVSALPYNTYNLVFGSTIDIVYIPGTPYIYKAGLCMNQSLYNGVNSCNSYTCQSVNCSSCSMSSGICSICKAGFTRDEGYQCSNSTLIQNTTNQNSTSNSTNSSNTTISQNSTN